MRIDCAIFEGCQSALEKLSKYYEVYICTAYIWPERKDLGGRICKQKYDYIVKHFSFLNPYNIMMVNNKHMCKADIRIDDKLSNLEEGSFNLLFSAYHNRNISDEELEKNSATRVNSWADIEEILLKNV